MVVWLSFCWGQDAEQLKYIENFRDLGGYETKNGKQIRWGKIFRSGEFNSLTANSINRIKNMGIKTLIDFRDSEDIIKTSPELGFDNVINLPGSLHYRQNLLPRLEKEEPVHARSIRRDGFRFEKSLQINVQPVAGRR